MTGKLIPQVDDLSFHLGILAAFPHSFEVGLDLAVESEALTSLTGHVDRLRCDIASKLKISSLSA